jgi:hypothetical protein
MNLIIPHGFYTATNIVPVRLQMNLARTKASMKKVALLAEQESRPFFNQNCDRARYRQSGPLRAASGGCLRQTLTFTARGAPSEANNLQQSWRFDKEPPKAVLRDVWTINWILGC